MPAMEDSFELNCRTAEASNEILACLASSSDPLPTIMRRYEEAEDKHLFVTALVWTLLLRHRQWQLQQHKLKA